MDVGMLHGVTVLEMASVISGPFAGMLLADLGARVIKVEAPGQGDAFRVWAGGSDEISSAFAAYNRAKESVALDIKTEAGRAAYRSLAARVDVILDNFRPGKLDELGIGPESLRAAYPHLVYCSVSGMGQVGPLRDRPTYDAVAQAMGGLWSQLTDMSAPRPVGPPISDQLTGLYAAQGILAALLARARTGEGRWLDVSMLGATIAFQPHAIAEYLNGGKIADSGSRARISQSYAFVCADDLPLAVHLSSPPKFWAALLRVVERPDLADDPRFATKADRETHYEALHAELAASFRTRPRDVWIDLLVAADVPCGPINTVAEALDAPQAQALGMTRRFGSGPRAIDLVGSGISDMAQPDTAARRPVPRLGEHTAAVLAEFGASRPDTGAAE